MEQIKNLLNLQTPCFILDNDEFKRSIIGFKNALDANFGNNILGYSVKTNSVPKCLSIAKQFGVYAEVVSYDEYELAILCGFEKSKIIYNGPMKSKESFIDAIMHGAIVNIESKREIEWLKELPKNRKFNIGIRLNINISKISPEDADGNDDNSRFGFSDDTLEFKEAFELINSISNISISGLHIHRTAHNRSLHFYEKSIEYACSIIEKYHLEIKYLDVGGGYFGIFPNKPTYQQYSDCFAKVLKSHNINDICLIVEPGNALTASCFSFLTDVIDVKSIDNKTRCITTNGSRNDIDPFFRKDTYFYDIISIDNNSSIIDTQIICGCTCLEYDRLFCVRNHKEICIGDKILYKNVGAYTMCLSPMFIRYIPNIYLKTDDSYILIREKWTANEFILKNKF